MTATFRKSHLTSNSAEATASNNSRKLVRDSGGTYHLVFETWGEIYYQKSTDGGSSWTGFKRLSSGNGSNKFPSITGTSTKQFVVWQRYNQQTGKYDTYFTKNIGSGWSTATTISRLSGLSSTTDPLPVVTYKTQGSNYRVLVCARGQRESYNGILYQYSDSPNEGSSWYPTSNYRITSTTSSSKSPSLSMGANTPNAYIYVTYDYEGDVFFNTYNSSWGSVENVSSGSGCVENKNASVEVDGNSGKNVAWEGKKTSNNKYVIVHKRKTSSWGVPKYFEPGSGNEFHRPSITGHSDVKRSIVWHDNYGAVYRTYTADGNTWSTMAWADTWLQHANLSAGTSTAKYVFTGGSDSPYQIYLSSETLPLGGMGKLLASAEGAQEHLKMLPCPQHYHRAAMLADTTNSLLLWVQWGEITVKTRKGEEIPVSFVTWEDSLSKITQETAFTYLTTESLLLPDDADSLEWMQELYACGLERTVTRGTCDLEVELAEAKTGQPLAVLNQASLPVSLTESRTEGKVITDISAYKGEEVVLKIYPVGLAQHVAGVTFNVGEVFSIENPFLERRQPKAQPHIAPEVPLPLAYKLEQNYPNPFNHETTIRYQLPEAGEVTLDIYNILGQKVMSLVKENKKVGYYQVSWNGKTQSGEFAASGIYLYRLEGGNFVAIKKMLLLE